MQKIVWTHNKDGSSSGYLLSDVSHIDKKGRYIFESNTEDPFNCRRDDKMVRTVIGDKSVITTITDIATNQVEKRYVERISSITFEERV